MRLRVQFDTYGIPRGQAATRWWPNGPLYLCALTPESSKSTCGPYAYTITCAHASHTAFRTLDALRIWLQARGLGETPIPPAESGKSVTIQGQYRLASWMDPRGFWDLMVTRVAPPIPVLCNGDYTLGILTRDGAGVIIVNKLNPNVPRPVLNREHAMGVLGERKARAHIHAPMWSVS